MRNSRAESRRGLSPASVLDLAVLLTALVVVRCVMLFALGGLCDASEFTDDWNWHIAVSERPLMLIQGETLSHGQHPTLLPIILSPFLRAWRSLLADFYAVRATWISFEVLALFLVWWSALYHLGRRMRILTFAMWIASPVAWMTTVVMAQDEIVAAAWLAAVLLLLTRKRFALAIGVCALGVAAAKIYLALPLLALIVCLRSPSFFRRLGLGVALAGGPYVVSALLAVAGNNPLPLVGFWPAAPFGVNAWALVSTAMAPAIAGALSGALVICALTGIALYSRTIHAPPQLLAIRTSEAMLCASFWLFYHVNPEYYVLPAMLIALRLRSLRAAIAYHCALSLFWFVNFFYGVACYTRTGTGSGKQPFVALYGALFAFPPEALHKVSLVAAVFCGAALVYMSLRGMAYAAAGPLSHSTSTSYPDAPEASGISKSVTCRGRSNIISSDDTRQERPN